MTAGRIVQKSICAAVVMMEKKVLLHNAGYVRLSFGIGWEVGVGVFVACRRLFGYCLGVSERMNSDQVFVGNGKICRR